jgi:hypothetical protein
MTEAQPKRSYTWIAVFIGVTVGLASFILWYLKIDPFHEPLDGFMAGMQASVKTLTSTWGGAAGLLLDQMNKNPIATGGSILAGTSAIVSLYSKFKSDRAKVQVEVAAAKAQSESQKLLITQGQAYSQAQTKIEDLQKKLDVYGNDTFAVEAKTVIERQKQELLSAKAQLEILSKQIETMRLKTYEVKTVA